MTIVFVLIAIFVAALGLMLLVFAKQQNEKKKLEIQKRIRQLADRGKQLQILLDELPPHYLSQEFRTFIVSQWMDLLHEQQQLGASESRLRPDVEAAQKKRDEVHASHGAQPEPVTDVKIANGVRRNLKQLNKVIVGLYQEKKISHRIAQGYLNQIKQAFNQTMIEVLQHSARQAEAEGNHRIALVHYKRIMSELNRSNPGGIHNQTLLECRETIKKLEELIAQEEAQKANNELASGFDEMMEEQDSWKKKQIYDD